MGVDETRTTPLSGMVRTLAFPPLERVRTHTVCTAQAAYYLNRKSQTLRYWATKPDKSPLHPIRLGGRLAWRVSDIKDLLEIN